MEEFVWLAIADLVGDLFIITTPPDLVVAQLSAVQEVQLVVSAII
jgi:hypothetical protein